MIDLVAIQNFQAVSDLLGTSGQPTPDQFAAIREAGYEVVVNLSMPDSPDAVPDESERITALGMEYIAIPVAWDRPNLDDLEQFFAAMERCQGRKVFVHCARNMRVSAFVFLYRVLRLDAPVEAAWREVLRIWEPNPVWQSFIWTALHPGNPDLAASSDEPLPGRLPAPR
jgi:protein tyrosine phosphatase (PTP) superfamily phosphohydrolase (DUF442 family)